MPTRALHELSMSIPNCVLRTGHALCMRFLTLSIGMAIEECRPDLVPGISSSIWMLSTEKRRLLEFPDGPSPAA